MRIDGAGGWFFKRIFEKKKIKALGICYCLQSMKWV